MNEIKVGRRKASLRTESKNISAYTGGSYRHQYSDDELARLRESRNGGAYVLFNNLSMYGDPLSFKQLIQSGR